MQAIPRFNASDRVDDIHAALAEAGCAVVTGAIDGSARSTLVGELATHLDAAKVETSVAEADFYPGHTRRVTALLAKSNTVQTLVMDERLLGLCDVVLGPNCERVQLHVCSSLVVGPGARSQVLHREDDAYPFFPVPRPNLVLASMWAMTDFTASNGATRLVPGSHRWETGRVARDDEVLSAEMPAGSVLVWMGGTLHGAGANRSAERWRHGVFVSYSLGWLRQEENQYLDVPPAVARTLSSELRALVGYKMSGSLGFYDPTLSR